MLKFLDFVKTYFNKRLVVAFFMGISSGLPLLITLTLMQAWAKDAGVGLKEIGLMALVGLPYTLKFFWSPIFDRFTLPFLGRRRGWLILMQAATALSILGMGLSNPTAEGAGLSFFISMAFLITLFSASQDVVIDAYRREDLKTAELGLGSSYYVYGYRVGMLIVSGGGMILSDFMSWASVFTLMAACMLPGMLITFWAPEPKLKVAPPANFTESVIDPFVDFFKKDGAIVMLVFILLYKVGDNLAGAMATPFYLELGFQKSEIGAIAKLFGFWATLGGAFIGGVTIMKIGINRALWAFGFLQMISTAGFAILAKVGYSLPWLTGVITFENLSAGMGTAAFMAFMASITNKKFTATQYALLTSLMGVPRVILSSVTGIMAQGMGWYFFFIFCTLVAIPGMFLLLKFAPWNGRFKDIDMEELCLAEID